MSKRELLMDNGEKEWLQRKLDDIKARIAETKACLDDKPCVEHGIKLASLEQLEEDKKNARKFKLTRTNIVVSLWMLILTALIGVIAYGEYIKQ